MTTPKNPTLSVETVVGRYPSRPRVFQSENITAEVVVAGDGRFVIRLDDKSAEDMWIQLHVRVREEGAT